MEMRHVTNHVATLHSHVLEGWFSSQDSISPGVLVGVHYSILCTPSFSSFGLERNMFDDARYDARWKQEWENVPVCCETRCNVWQFLVTQHQDAEFEFTNLVALIIPNLVAYRTSWFTVCAKSRRLLKYHCVWQRLVELNGHGWPWCHWRLHACMSCRVFPSE